MEIMRQDMAVTHRNPNKSKQMTTAFSCSFICCIFTRLAINFTIFFLGGGVLYTEFFWGGKANDSQRMAEAHNRNSNKCHQIWDAFICVKCNNY